MKALWTRYNAAKEGEFQIKDFSQASPVTDSFLCFWHAFSRQGQTQAQYLNFGNPTNDGKADAEITRFGSRATVCTYFILILRQLNLFRLQLSATISFFGT